MNRIYLLFVIVFFIATSSAYSSPIEPPDDLYQRVEAFIKIINELIADPTKANMETHDLLMDRHNEDEYVFSHYMSTDGTHQALRINSEANSTFINQFGYSPIENPSVLMQYLRLNLLLQNEQYRWVPSEFQLKEIDVYDFPNFIARCDYVATNRQGQTVLLPAEIYVAMEMDGKISLWKIVINDRTVFGWW